MGRGGGALDSSSLTLKRPPAMPRTLLKVFGGWWVVVESDFSVHLLSKALAYVRTKLDNLKHF